MRVPRAKRVRRARAALLLLLGGLFGCSDDATSDDGSGHERPRGEDEVGGVVVATVDGVGITVEQVAEEARRTSSTPREALTALVELELLHAESKRRGFESDRRVRRVRDRGLAQRTLALEVEAEVTPESIEEAVIREAYERAGTRFRSPERRGSRHVLVRVPDGAPEPTWTHATRLARDIAAELREGGAADALYRSIESRRLEGGLSIVVEDIPAIDRGAAFDPGYLEGLFSTTSTGLVPGTARTRFGIHVINVTSIVDAMVVPLSEARAGLIDELVLEGRRAKLQALLERLQRDADVEVDEAVAASAFARGLPE